MMSINKNSSRQPFSEHVNVIVKIDGETLEKVTSLNYLCSIYAYNGSIDPELKGVNKLNKTLHSKNISLKRKIQIFESSVLTILLNTAETKVYNV